MIDVLIIGGGLSGLASAVKLAGEGLRVSLFERTARLGGRCYSYRDTVTGDVVDNGQHVLIGAYHHLLHYLDIIGTGHLLKSFSHVRLPLYNPDKGFAEFNIRELPKPLHFTAGLVSFPLLTMSDRRHMIGIGLELQRLNPKSEDKLKNKTIEQWLVDHKQSDGARKNFWYPVAVSIMNELPDRASALLFARSIKKAFFGKRSDSAILIPTVGQTELYTKEAVEYLKDRECEVHIKSEVKSIVCEADRVAGLRLKNGKIVRGGHVICAVPFDGVAELVPQRIRLQEPFKNLHKFESSPIISFHLWFDRDFTELEYVGCIDFNLQWIFNRRKIFKEEGKSDFYITAVISGAHDYIALSKEDLVRIAIEDIHRIFPRSRKANLTRATVIKEKRATFSATPHIEIFRPQCETPLRGFYFAGDWTDTGYPATIEGAVLSGFRAAELVKSR